MFGSCGRLLYAAVLALFTIGVSAQDGLPAVEREDGPRQLDTVVVEGQLPGPGLWKVSRGDHVMWVLGRLSPLPKKLEWQNQEIVAVLDQASALLEGPGITVDSGLGFFRSMFLLPKALAARKPADGRRLQEQLPEASYARWSALKQRYLPRNRSVEKWRPLFAVDRLFKAAIRRAGLTYDLPIDEQVEKLAKKRKLTRINPALKVTLENPRALLDDFRRSEINDLGCFNTTLEWLERDLDLMRSRANAWSIGDLERLRELAGSNPRSACIETLLETDVLRRHGLADLEIRVRDAWLETVDKTMSEHRVSLALMPIAELLAADGYLQQLERRGYRVEAPE